MIARLVCGLLGHDWHLVGRFGEGSHIGCIRPGCFARWRP